MKRFLTTITIVMSISSSTPGADANWRTHCEKSGFESTPRYEETIEYCTRLSDGSPHVHYATFGRSPRGRDLPLLIIDRRGNFTPDEVRATDNAVLLIEAGIHAGEICGKDAGLMLIRDIVIDGAYGNILDNLTILFIPIFNVDGHERFGPYNRINQNGPREMGWRTTARNLNLNRDFLKADAPEMRDWLRLYLEWLPEFFVDCHSTDGADYQYPLTYGLEIHGNMERRLTEWTRDVCLVYLEDEMERSGMPISPYVMFRSWHDVKSGMRSWVATPVLSEGYTAIQNRPGLLIETHMLKSYRVRVEATYEMLRHTAELVNDRHEELRGIVREADRYTASEEFRKEPYTLRFEMAPDSVIIDFLGVDYERVESTITGRARIEFKDEPVTYRIPYFHRQVPSVQVDVPEAYIIPPEWTEVIDRLELHGVEFSRLEKAETLSVESYRFSDVQWHREPYEGRQRVMFKAAPVEERRVYPPGSAVVNMDQRSAGVVMHMLEPEAPSSYLYWGFFNGIFEQKEYAESYVMEKMAAVMLENDPALAEEFEKRKAEEPEFAGNARAVLNWFYSKTPYWDNRKNVYPVGRLPGRI